MYFVVGFKLMKVCKDTLGDTDLHNIKKCTKQLYVRLPTVIDLKKFNLTVHIEIANANYGIVLLCENKVIICTHCQYF